MPSFVLILSLDNYEKDLKLNLSEHAFIQPMWLLRDHDVFLFELHIQLDLYPQMEVYS